MAADARTLAKRVGGIIVVLGALSFAVSAGEFSTFDLWRQKRQISRLNVSVDSLQRVVDSLKGYEDKVRHDPATQERIAREVFGMVRGNKELLYRFSDADSTKKIP
jgi:cell division protein FtsB